MYIRNAAGHRPALSPQTAVALAVAALFAVLLAGCAGRQESARPEAATASAPAADRLSYADRRRFDALFLEAIRQKEKENYDAEYELISAALAIDSMAPEALFEAAQLKLSFMGYADTLHRAEGDALLRRAIAIDTANMDYKETLAAYLTHQNRYGEAISLYRDMVASHPTADRLSTLVRLQEQVADFAGAVGTLDRLEQLEGKNDRISMEKVKLYNQLGDNDNAYKAIEDLCDEYPNDLSYRVLLGDLYQQNGYHDKALAIYRDVLAAEPDNGYAQISLLAYYKAAGQDSLYRQQAQCVVLNPRLSNETRVEAMRGYVGESLQAKRDSSDVLRLFDKALAMPQENRSMAELCAYYMTAIGLPQERLEPVMEKILAVEPDYDRARLQLLYILLRRHDMKRLAEVCHEGRLYAPTQVLYYYYEGMAYIQLDDYAAAHDALEAGAERLEDEPGADAQTASELYAALGDVRYEMGLKDEAYAAYEEALVRNNANLLCLNNYAYFLSLDGKRLDYAAAMSLRTVKADPDNVTFLDTYAWILYKQRDYAGARAYIDRAVDGLEETAENAGIFDHAGDIYYRLRQRNTALRFWIKALSLADEKDLRTALRRKVRTRRL